jgi:hypothetical protein
MLSKRSCQGPVHGRLEKALDKCVESSGANWEAEILEKSCFVPAATVSLFKRVANEVRPQVMPPRCSVDFSRPPVPPQGSPRDLWIDMTRPEPFVLPRRQLDRDFAVFLMRATYDIVDDLDICPMSEFQKLFFEIRQREWSKYLGVNPVVRQGELADVSHAALPF